jgi:hypothetical protein
MFSTVFSALFGPLVQGIIGMIDKSIPDATRAEELKAQIQTMLLQFQSQMLQSATQVILAEAQGQSWLQRNWRPLLMLTCIVIIFNNYVLYPYMKAIFHWGVALELPPDLWTMLQVGVGGYVVGKSAETIATQVASIIANKK